MGNVILNLIGSVVFIDFVKKEDFWLLVKGVLVYIRVGIDGKYVDFYVIEINYDFGM